MCGKTGQLIFHPFTKINALVVILHHRHRSMTKLLVGNGDDKHLQNRRMCSNYALDFFRLNTLSATEE